MRTLLQTHSLSFAESVKLALEAKGIDAVLLDPMAASYLSFAGRVRVAILNDAEYGRAMRIVHEMEPPPGPPLRSWWWHKRGLLGIGLGFGLLVVSPSLAGTRYERITALSGLTLFLLGIGLIVVGFRADRVTRP